MRAARPLLLPAALVLLPLAGVAGLRDPVASYPVLLALAAVATAGWLLAVRRCARGECAGPGSLVVVLVVAGLARGLLLVPETPLSDDLYRYLWDGRVGNAGIHPFRHAPLAPELGPLRDDVVWPRINHPDIPTIYPPAAQLYFRLLDRVAPTAGGARAAGALLDLGAVLLLAMLLRLRGRPPSGASVAGWCPLAILESAGGGHVDALGAVLLLGALTALERPRRGRAAAAGLLAGLSILVKPLGVLLAPGILRAGPARRRVAILAGVLVALLLVLPYLREDVGLFTGFLAYARHWRFNDCLYSPAVAAGLSPRGARVVLGALLVATAFLLPWKWRDPLASGAGVVGAALLFSPTVHPWYALWLVPLLPFLPGSLRAAGYALAALLPVSYAAAWGRLQTGTWAEPPWARAVVWVPVLVLLVGGILRSRRR